jgi:cysteine desulfurase family protein (TIGR01976 family)
VSTSTFDIASIRQGFTSLQDGFAFFDAPGGTQVPDQVGEAVARAMREASGNLGAPYATGDRVAAILSEAERRSAAFLGCEPGEISFGSNMTSLNFVLSRAAARDFQPGDKILVSRLDHDGNVAPWRELAADKDLELELIGVNSDTTLDLDDLARRLTPNTKVVAFSWASNAVGTIIDAQRVCAMAHEVGALAWVDAVHYAAHEPIDVRAIDADVVLCSAYKWCGPRLGVGYARGSISDQWRPYKTLPSPSDPVGRRFFTGTFPYELLAGLNATYDYLDSLGGIRTAREYERALGEHFLAALPDRVRLYGLPGMEGRCPTYLVNVDGVEAGRVATELASRGFGVWAHDTWYSLGLYQSLGYEGDAVRIGIAHYNTVEEVDGLIEALATVQ